MECSRLFCQLILRGVRVIAFCRVREQCERLVDAIKQELKALGRSARKKPLGQANGG
jgi:DEAD/DEAH box helicase domain-containing protein